MSVTVTTGVARLNTPTVMQYLGSQSRRLTSGKRRSVLLRATPEWNGPAEVRTWDGELTARVVAAFSPLAVHELVLTHQAASPGEGPDVLVVLTDREDAELGPDLLAKVFRQRVNTVDTWEVVREAFGAGGTDHRLFDENWAAEALLDARPPDGGWPQLTGGVLTRGKALEELTLRRLGIGRYDSEGGTYAYGTAGAAGLDIYTLLSWSLVPGGPERFLALRAPERAGLTRFLSEGDRAALPGQGLLTLVGAGHGPDAVAFGLVCAALWEHAAEEAEDYRARGRAERWFGEEHDAHGEGFDALAAAFGRSCEEFVSALLLTGRSQRDEEAGNARRLTRTVLDRSASLVRQFGAERAAALSPLLEAGLEARFGRVGDALRSGAVYGVSRAIEELESHFLAKVPRFAVRTERARMAQRLAQWLAGRPATESETVAAGVARHVAETGWVDLALEHIEAGGDLEPSLKSAYDDLCTSARALRKDIDRNFASTLATWTAAGTDPGSMLTVESFLPTVVAPVVKAQERRVLLLVLDGMSAAVASELGEELREQWAEYDPVPLKQDARGAARREVPQRRAMAAALPTVTGVSRASLFAARLTTGSQADEKRIFPAHRFWGGQDVAVFHKDDLRGESGGAAFGPGLYEALTGGRTHVAVVLNTVDDRLATEQKLGDGAWRTGQIAKLPDLLQIAAAQGFAVILTSDHGHVVDRHGERVDAGGAESARHRTPGGTLADAEIALSGPRVVAPEPGGEMVALWDADSRYTARRAGYHDGASLAEFTIPVLAFLPFGAEPPTGWRELGSQQPLWWTLSPDARAQAGSADVEADAALIAGKPVPSERTVQKRRQRDAERVAGGEQALFEVSPPEPQPGPATDSDAGSRRERREQTTHAGLVADLFKSPVFESQLELLARTPKEEDLAQYKNAVHALLEAGGTLPVTALAQRANLKQLRRADGFAAVLRQLLNYDGVQVLETLPDGRTLRLDAGLLRNQFEVK